jgi:DNA polymerase-3 subunit gamma/tau
VEKKSPDVTVKPVAAGVPRQAEPRMEREVPGTGPGSEPKGTSIPLAEATSPAAAVRADAYVPKRKLEGQVSIKAAGIAAPVERSATAHQEAPTDQEGSMPASTKTVNEVLLNKLWRDFAEEQRNKGRNSLYATLVYRQPQVVGPGRISFAIVNEVQEKVLRTERPELLGFLRRELGDMGLELEVLKEETQVRPRYTPLDRFRLMAEKNPALNTLRTVLDLDLGQ